MAQGRRPPAQSAPGASDGAEFALTPGQPRSELVRIGRIAGIHGLRGALRYKPDNPESDSLADLESITIETGGERREYPVLATAPVGRGMLKIELEGLTDPNQAEALKGGVVMIPADRLPPVEPHEFYYYQAIGCEVVLTDGSSVGTIAEMFSNGANDVMVVREGRREVLVPVIEDVVKAIDLDRRRVVIEPVPGLLD
jgi:16S rRNA processing protein RimM